MISTRQYLLPSMVLRTLAALAILMSFNSMGRAQEHSVVGAWWGRAVPRCQGQPGCPPEVVMMPQIHPPDDSTILRGRVVVTDSQVGIHTLHSQEGFTNASLQGNYALFATIGTNEGAAVGILTLDGQGTLTGSVTLNLPGAEGAREVLPVELNGTYLVNPDGTVVETTITTLPDGTTLEGQIDHIITQSTGTTATMMNGIVRDASPFVPGVIQVTPGVVQVTRYTRLPEQTTFGNASLQGNYGFFTTIGTNTVLSQMGVNGAAARGTITFDGQGKLAASVVFNIPTPDGTRALVPLSLAGQLTMNADGTGIEHTTVTFPDGTTIEDTLDLVIGQAMGPTATEVIGVFRDPNPFGVQIVRYTLRP